MSSTVHSPDCPDGMNMLADLAVHASSETALIHVAGRLLLSSVSEDLSSALSPVSSAIFELLFTRKGICVKHRFCIWVGKESVTSKSCDTDAFIFLFTQCIYMHFSLSCRGCSSAFLHSRADTMRSRAQHFSSFSFSRIIN